MGFVFLVGRFYSFVVSGFISVSGFGCRFYDLDVSKFVDFYLRVYGREFI